MTTSRELFARFSCQTLLSLAVESNQQLSGVMDAQVPSSSVEIPFILVLFASGGKQASSPWLKNWRRVIDSQLQAVLPLDVSHPSLFLFLLHRTKGTCLLMTRLLNTHNIRRTKLLQETTKKWARSFRLYHILWVLIYLALFTFFAAVSVIFCHSPEREEKTSAAIKSSFLRYLLLRLRL